MKTKETWINVPKDFSLIIDFIVESTYFSYLFSEVSKDYTVLYRLCIRYIWSSGSLRGKKVIFLSFSITLIRGKIRY